MSWAADNPEMYDEICSTAIAKKVMKEAGWDDCGDLIDVFISGIQLIGSECPKAFSELCSWAHKEIAEGESSYHTRGC